MAEVPGAPRGFRHAIEAQADDCDGSGGALGRADEAGGLLSCVLNPFSYSESAAYGSKMVSMV